jgi:endonuclease/exonuclease/phosphatase family metal-dependent hydrolase
MKKYLFLIVLFVMLTSCGESNDSNGQFDAPSNLRASLNSSNQVVLNWQDNSSEELEFIIQRKEFNGEFVTIDTTAFELETYLDDSVELAVEYVYRVAAIFEDTTSTWSNEISITTESWFANLNFGTDSTFEVVTWNIENFPKAAQTTIDYVVVAILAIDAEVFALQEIENEGFFQTLINELNQIDEENLWEGFRANSASYEVNLAYIYKSNQIQLLDIYEIYESNYYNRPFPRKPLILQFTFLDEEFWIINNHFKAFGDGALDLNDPWDEETRRYDACNLLDEYITETLPDENVIIVGDFNDRLDDPQIHNVFWTFTNESSKYFWADMDIAVGSSEFWSYPGRPNHLDHILITNELFDEFNLEDSEISTILVDSFLEGLWNEYDDFISDHRPVGLKLAL